MIFDDNQNITWVTHHDEDCKGDHEDDFDVCNTSNICKVDETIFMIPSSTDWKATSTILLR